MDLFKRPNQQNLLYAGVVVTLSIALYQINWPRLIFRSIFSVLAPTKERIWPSDDVKLSPQVRGLAWVLLTGPPPPHNIGSIRTMMKHFWPNVWPPEGKDVHVQRLPVPRQDSETLLIWPTSLSKSQTDTALIHMHGGGMVAGTTGTERGFAVELARRLGVPVLTIDYGLVPEVFVEEAVQDAIDVYQYFVKEYSQFQKISFLGGSAGAGYSLLATLKLKELGVEPAPASMVLLSPAPGMEFLPPEDEYSSWASLTENATVDGYMAGEFYQYITSIVYKPEANKEFFRKQLSNLQGLPPCLVTIGSYEVIKDGATKLVKRLQEASVEVDYKEYWNMQHCHLAFFELTPESSQAMDEVVEWLQTSWK